MSTNATKRNPSVKPNEHSAFALELAQYLNALKGDMSGRELARKAAAGGHAHWAQILAGAKVMTTNDIKIAAEVFELDPYEFVSRAREHAASVRGTSDDVRVLTREQEAELRRSDLDLAALRGQNEANNPRAD